MLTLEELEGLIKDIERLHDSFCKNGSIKNGISGYNLMNTNINMHVSTYSGSWDLYFSRTIYSMGRAKEVRFRIPLEKVLEELPYEAVSMLLMNPAIFGPR